MKIVISALWMISLLASGTAWAQAAIFPPNAAGVTMGHWHLNSKDPEATKKILVAMGGNAVKFGNRDIVKFPGVAVFLTQGGNAKPASGGTVGSVINHVGFTVTNTAAAVAAWKAAGVSVFLNVRFAPGMSAAWSAPRIPGLAPKNFAYHACISGIAASGTKKWM